MTVNGDATRGGVGDEILRIDSSRAARDVAHDQQLLAPLTA
jgi:hypothetical protein